MAGLENNFSYSHLQPTAVAADIQCDQLYCHVEMVVSKDGLLEQASLLALLALVHCRRDVVSSSSLFG